MIPPRYVVSVAAALCPYLMIPAAVGASEGYYRFPALAGDMVVPDPSLWRLGMPHCRAQSSCGAEAVPDQLGGLRGDLDAVEAGGVLAQDLALDLGGQIDVVLLLQILR